MDLILKTSRAEIGLIAGLPTIFEHIEVRISSWRPGSMHLQQILQ